MLIDTNVISELMKTSPMPAVAGWARAHVSARSYLSAITIAELRFGCSRLPQGARRTLLDDAITGLESDTFLGRILPFTVELCRAFGDLKANRERQGRPIEDADAVIAATALANGFSLATRNTRDFEGLGLTLINPFEPAA